MKSLDIKKAGLKRTLPRVKILEVLQISEQRHLSAEDVYKQLLNTGSEIGLATVYRVLTQFEAAGLVIRHHFEIGQAVFELSQDSHHDHMICVKCNKIIEFLDDDIERIQKEIAKKNNLKIVDHRMVLYCECRDGCT